MKKCGQNGRANYEEAEVIEKEADNKRKDKKITNLDESEVHWSEGQEENEREEACQKGESKNQVGETEWEKVENAERTKLGKHVTEEPYLRWKKGLGRKMLMNCR